MENQTNQIDRAEKDVPRRSAPRVTLAMRTALSPRPLPASDRGFCCRRRSGTDLLRASFS
jgi:hypothetical protein